MEPSRSTTTELLLRREFAACRCGCGFKPLISRVTVRAQDIYAGEPQKCLRGHGGRVSAQRRAAAAQRGAPDQQRSGWCECGCGGKTTVARRSCTANDQYHSQPQRFIRGHWAKWRSQQLAAQRNAATGNGRVVETGTPRVTTQTLCVSCFERRPAAALIDGVCVVCVVRKQRQLIVAQQLQDREREKLRRRREADTQRTATMDANGSRYVGPARTFKS